LDKYYFNGLGFEFDDATMEPLFDKRFINYYDDFTDKKATLIQIGKFGGAIYKTIPDLLRDENIATTKTVYRTGFPLGWVKLEKIEEVAV
jgi:hypothetical protein